MIGRHPSAYDLAAAALLLLTAVAAVLLVLCAVCLVRRGGDAARSWIALYRAAFSFFVFAIVLSLAEHLIAIVYRQLYDASFRANATAAVSGLLQAQVQTSVIGALLHELVVILLLITLVGVSSGIGIVHDGAESSTNRILRLGSYALAALLLILDLAAFALSEKLFALVYSNRPLSENGIDAPETIWRALRATRVTFAMLIVQLVFALAVFVRSVVAAVQTRLDPRVKTAVIYLGLCSVLLLLKTSYDVGYYAKYTPPSVRWRGSQTPLPEPYFAIISIILSIWPVFFVLVALLVLAIKKQNGLRANRQPFAMVQDGGPGLPLQTPWGYNYSPQSQQPLHPGWQQQQQQQSPGQYQPHEMSPPPQPGHDNQHAPQGQYAQFRHGISPQPQWHEVSSPYHQQHPYGVHEQTASWPSPPPPAHSEAMGLYHQADGTPPQASPLPYDEKT